MKSKDIARRYNLNLTAFDAWLKQSGFKHKTGVRGIDVEDGQDVDEIVLRFTQELTERREQLEHAEAERQHAAQLKQQALASMLITSGFTFDGYTITRYSGYISGDDVVQIDRGRQGFFASATNVGDRLMESLVKIRRNALAELKEAAHALGCNAVIGVDFDYLTLDPETVNANGGTLYLPYVFGVTANGNAVVIERDDRA